MSDPTRASIVNAFDAELDRTPVPEGLRPLSVRAAVTAPRRRSNQPALLALVAVFVMVALVATLIIGSHALRTVPAPSRPAPSAVPPSPRWEANLVYDTARHELVLFGGGSQSGPLNDTWTWDGKDWRLYPARSAPPAGLQPVMTYDDVHREVVLYGVVRQQTNTRTSPTEVESTWTWNGTSWKQLHPGHEPGLSFDWTPTMAFDPVSKTVVLFGFRKVSNGTGSRMQAETWSWTGTNWIQLAPPTSPEGLGQFIGGGARLYFAGGTWQWDGTAWLNGPAHNPPGGQTVYDAARGQFVEFDGDTWTWDGGSTWIREHPKNRPPAVGYLAYFPPLHQVVMWGDAALGMYSNEMWAWDGADWSRLQAGTVEPTPSPGHLDVATPAKAEAFIRRTVTSSSPVLLPAWLPDGMDAVVDANPDYFTVIYRSDQREKRIDFGIVVANPPPAGGPNALDTRVKFRNALAPKFGKAGDADYVVYDTTDPHSQRYLMWTEPGKMAPSAEAEGFGGPGVPYFLVATGLTDAEFWQVANSVR